MADSSVEELDHVLRTLLFAHSLLSPEDLLNKLIGLVTNIKWSPEDVNNLFNTLLQRFESTATNDRSRLLLWMMEMLQCIEINYITPTWKKERTGKTLIELVQDKTVTDEDLKKCLDCNTEKQLEEILQEIREQELNQIDEKRLKEVKDIVSSVDKDLTSNSDGSQQSGLKQSLLKLCKTVEKTKKFRPRLTQMVSWCIMVLSETGRLIQVGTGEGKSCIVAMFAAFQAMKGKKVDVMSSSPVLAERDMEEWQDFYKALKISVDCNINRQIKDLRKCYDCQIVYGTVEEFAGDWLQQNFHKEDIFGQRTFECAIVDEVDSLMLDKGLHTVYLSSDMPAMQHLNPLLAFIWATANQYKKVGETVVGRKNTFHKVVLEKMTGVKGKDVDEFTILQIAEDTALLEKGSVEDLRKNLSLLTQKTTNITVNQLEKFFKVVEKKFPSCQFALHYVNNDVIQKVKEQPQQEAAERLRVPLLLLDGGFCQYMYSDSESVLRAAEAEIKQALHFTPCELNKDEKTCNVPGFLSDLVNSKLRVWIINAFEAHGMTMDHEYVIERHGIVPVDYSCTGVIENHMKWTDGLQQFIEMKHASKLSDMTAITNYMSNVGLLQKYGHHIFGVSGTLGQQAEIETLQKIYNGIKTCQIPSFKRRKLFEVEGAIIDNEDEWIEKICDVVTAQTSHAPYRGQRAVLVICETIHRAKVLHHALGYRVRNKKLYISNNMDNSTIFKKIQAGDVIIATNLAGRGTDLQVSDQVKTAGGLFVVQTFLPKNARVEAQAFGRTARQGSPGSAQLIVCCSHLEEPLRLLALMGQLQSLFQSIINFLPHLFGMRLRCYQKRYSREASNAMSSTLLHILTGKTNSGINRVKKIRDDLVAQQLGNYLECNIPNIKKKEELFSHYLNTLDDVYKSSKPAEPDLSALNEFWGMWLLIHFNENDSIMELKRKLTEDLKTARQKVEVRQSPSSNLHHYTAIGNDLRKSGDLAASIEMYTKAIQEDHCWAAIAYYNRALTSLTQQDRQQDLSCIHQALEDLQNALKSVEFYLEQIKVTHTYVTQVNDHCGYPVTRFGRHMTTRQEVFLCFKENINKAIKKLERARGLGSNIKVEESLVYFLVPGVYYLPIVTLSSQFLAILQSREPLKSLQLITDPYFDIVNELQCLESLGLTHVYNLDTVFSLGGFFSRLFR